MADVTKEKIIQINTKGAEKNVKTLKQQIKELRDQLGQLEKGTAEYDAVAKQLADTNQRQIEINEAMKYSNQDVGATLGNLARISAGVIGAIQGVNAVMQMFGASEEDAAKATQKLQQSMALIQSIAAIDTASKALKGLTVSFGNLSKNVTKTTAAEALETKQIKINTTAKNANARATTMMTTRTNAARTAVTTLTTGIKSMTKALLTNPFTMLLAGASAAIMVITNLIEKNKEAKEAVEEQRKAEEERNKAWRDMPNDFTMVENSVKWANSGMEELTNSTSKLYNEIQDVAGEIQRNDPKNKMNAWKMAFDQVYRDAVKQGDKTKQQLIELTRLQWEYYNVRKANYENDAEYYKAQQAALAKLYAAYAAQTKSNTTNGVVKTIKELIEEFKKLYKELLTEEFNWSSYKSVFNGFYNEAEIQLDKINHLIKSNDLNKALSDQFKEALEVDNGELTKFKKFDITLDLIFDKKQLESLEKELENEEETLAKFTSGETKATQKALDAQKKKVAQLKEQIATYNELAETVIKYLDAVDTERKKNGEEATKKREQEIEREKQLYLDYWTDVLNNNPWTEINNTLATTESSLEKVNTQLNEINQEQEDLVAKGIYNRETNQRLDEIAEKRIELEKQQRELERKLEETNHQIRLKYIDEEYQLEKDNAAKLVQDLNNQRSARGGGVTDYNTDVDILNLQLQGINNQKNNVEQYYQQIMATVAEGTDQWIQLEIEKQAALDKLEEDGATKRVEIAQAEFERKAKIQQTYMNALSSVTSEISSLLGERMNAYEQDSKEYKRLQIAQATINTLSGTLAAFVSGFQSGIPWPGNLSLATLLGGLVFATGLESINNIKNESLKNSATATATSGNFGEYDTLSYMNDVDLLDSITDQRVYVTENDITSTQNRVRVRESDATF